MCFFQVCVCVVHACLHICVSLLLEGLELTWQEYVLGLEGIFLLWNILWEMFDMSDCDEAYKVMEMMERDRFYSSVFLSWLGCVQKAPVTMASAALCAQCNTIIIILAMWLLWQGREEQIRWNLSLPFLPVRSVMIACIIFLGVSECMCVSL